MDGAGLLRWRLLERHGHELRRGRCHRGGPRPRGGGREEQALHALAELQDAGLDAVHVERRHQRRRADQEFGPNALQERARHDAHFHRGHRAQVADHERQVGLLVHLLQEPFCDDISHLVGCSHFHLLEPRLPVDAQADLHLVRRHAGLLLLRAGKGADAEGHAKRVDAGADRGGLGLDRVQGQAGGRGRAGGLEDEQRAGQPPRLLRVGDGHVVAHHQEPHIQAVLVLRAGRGDAEAEAVACVIHAHEEAPRGAR
mmetsp:Transcript_86607/g.265008  ORF Transcript_86607/g.265008 Transcript_86607/m.265008 type:complete len:256 (-) Transcript_86607:359-1126(-)